MGYLVAWDEWFGSEPLRSNLRIVHLASFSLRIGWCRFTPDHGLCRDSRESSGGRGAVVDAHWLALGSCCLAAMKPDQLCPVGIGAIQYRCQDENRRLHV
jgi:hypothetical protein